MNYTFFILGVLYWIVFAYDIENDRDFWTWICLLTSLLLFFCSYMRYKHDINQKK